MLGPGIAKLGRIACVAVATLFSAVVALCLHEGDVHAQPTDEGSDIEMDPEPAGSGSGSESPTTPVQPPVPVKDPKAAKKLVTAGLAAVQKGDGLVKRKPEDANAQYEIARASFQQAADLGEDINVYFHLAGVEDKLGKHIEAVKHYRLVLRASSGVDPKIAKVISAKLEEVMGKVGTVTLSIVPDGTTVTLNNEQIGVSPLPEPLVLPPGTHVFTLTAPGFESKDTELKVEAGSESERKIELDSIKIVVEKQRPDGPDLGETPAVKKKPSILPMAISGGVAVALVGTAVVTGLLAKGQHDTFVAPGTTPTDRGDAREVGKDYAHLTDALFGGAIVAAGFGAYWYIFQYRPALKAKATVESDEPRPPLRVVPKVTVVPWVQPDSSGFAVFGKF